MKRGVCVYYEVYIDSLFLINFVMNLFCLELVNLTLMRTATRRRVVLGAALGAGLYLIPFLLGGPGWLKMLLGFLASSVIMILVTFRVKSVKAFFLAAQRLLAYSFLLGGIVLFLIRLFPGLRRALTSMMGILGMGTLIFMEVSYLLGQKKASGNICRVVLMGKGAKITVNALKDTGNGLVEPISGKPVSILEKSVFDSLWTEGRPGGFRAIPYHSIGKKRGILQGFQIPEIQIEIDGIIKNCRDVYVGVSEDKVAAGGDYKMILNPRLLEQRMED